MKACKTCRSYQYWLQCPKCGKALCQKCATKGEGGYPKMRAQNVCPFCNAISISGLKRLSGNEAFLDSLCR